MVIKLTCELSVWYNITDNKIILWRKVIVIEGNQS